MKYKTSKALLAASSAAVLLALAGCGERQDNQTVGQKVDEAISKTAEAGREVKQGAKEAARDTREAAQSVAEKTREATAKGEQEAREAAEKTREATADARTSVMGAGREAGQKMDDAGITSKVNTALATDKDLSANKIDVDTRDGVVTLMGTAPTAAAKARAGELAKNVKDVKSVNNQLVVKG